jgi:hypothetical protein
MHLWPLLVPPRRAISCVCSPSFTTRSLAVWLQTEVVNITSVAAKASSSTLTLSAPLKFAHGSSVETYTVLLLMSVSPVLHLRAPCPPLQQVWEPHNHNGSGSRAALP